MLSQQTKSELRDLGVRLANVRANPRGGHENTFEKEEADNPIRTARSVLAALEVRCLQGSGPPVAMWTEEHWLSLQILMLATEHMIVVEGGVG